MPPKKPRTNRKGSTTEFSATDFCQTPPQALDPLLTLLKRYCRIDVVWEPFTGEGNLIQPLADAGYDVIGTDILGGYNFFDMQQPLDIPWTTVISNPPYSTKYEVMEHLYALEQPFALLVPDTTTSSKNLHALWRKHGVPQVIMFNQRNQFKMPNKGYDGGGAQFHTIWYTHGYNFPRDLYVWDSKDKEFWIC